MTNPATLLARIVSVYRATSEVTGALGGHTENVQEYLGECDAQPSVLQAVYNMRSPGLLLRWAGFSGGSIRDGGPIVHQLVGYVRLGTRNANSAASHYALLCALVESIAPDGLPMRDYEFVESCGSMGQGFRLAPRTMVINQTGAQLDFWEFSFTLTEKE